MNLDYKNLKDKKVTVMGLGLHGGGVETVRWLAKQQAKILVTDLHNKKVLKPSIDKLKNLDVKYVLGKHRIEDFINADLIIKNPAVPKESRYLKIARKNGIPIETDVSIFFRLNTAYTIGITGTKGKSTTTTLIYKILKAAGHHVLMAGNIRISPLSLLNQIKKNTIIVLELSSWQLEDMTHLKISPQISVITNIFPEHLNRYTSMSQYVKAKINILKWQNHNDYTVLHKDSSLTYALDKNVKAKKFFFSTNELRNKNGCFIQNNKMYFRLNNKDQLAGFVKDIKLPGKHNRTNVLSALTVAKIYKINNITIKKTLRQFKGIPDRLEFIRSWHGIKFYNDTTATAPPAAIAALKTFNEKVTLIAGGYDKKLSYNELARFIKNKAKFTILLNGSASQKIIVQLKKIKYDNWLVVNNMEQAVRKAISYSKNIKTILLSPGAASFGMFLNEFDRGDQFKKVVKNLR